jgi:nucleoside-diphosphate-sugar epimerase
MLVETKKKINKNRPVRRARPVVLITGGSGFLGKALIRELLDDTGGSPLIAREIRVFDIKHPGRISGRRISYIKGDIRSQERLEYACRGVDIIFNCASVVDWGQHPKSFLQEVNVRGTQNVIAAAEKSGVKALVHTSTMDVLYEGRPIIKGDESMPYPRRYNMAYAETKAMGEKAVLAANRAQSKKGKGGPITQLRTCVIRPCGMFGEGDPYHVSSFLRMAQSGRLTFRMGNGRALFQHVYVGNVAHAHALAGKALLDRNSPAAGKTYFITDFEPKNFFDYMEPIISGIGYNMPPKNRSIPMPVVYILACILEGASMLSRPFFRFNPMLNRTSVSMVCKDLTFSSEKARSELGYRPRYSEEEAIARTIEYFKTHGPA